MKRRLVSFIEDMVKNIEKIEQFVLSKSPPDFLMIDNFRNQLVQSIETVGESLKKVSTKIKKRYRDISGVVLKKLSVIKNFFEDPAFIQNDINSFEKEKPI